MKYKLLKDLPDIKAGEYDYSLNSKYGSQLTKGDFTYNVPFTWLGNKEWFEEIKEVKSPEYKVGDYVVYAKYEYVKIFNVQKMNTKYQYNKCYLEDELRLPTEEELNTYFR